MTVGDVSITVQWRANLHSVLANILSDPPATIPMRNGVVLTEKALKTSLVTAIRRLRDVRGWTNVHLCQVLYYHSVDRNSDLYSGTVLH